MGNEGLLNTYSFNGERAHTQDHPPVLRTGTVKASNGVYAAGLVLMYNTDGYLVAYDGDDDSVIIGVCDESCDTATESTCIYLAHGTCRASCLTKTSSASLATADVQALELRGIYPL